MAAETLGFGLLDPSECAQLVRDEQALSRRLGLIFSDRDPRGFEVDPARYHAAEAFIDLQPPFDWLIPKLRGALIRAGAHFGMDDLALQEMPRVLTYPTGGHFDWHRDISSGMSLAPPRRLTCSIQLRRPEDYEGGELLVRGTAGGDPWTAPRALGAVAIFPAGLIHRASLVRSGVRQALVFWGY